MLRIISLLGALLCATPSQAATLSFNFNVQLFPMTAPWTPAPSNLAGAVEWSFDEADPINTASLTAINLTFAGKTFMLADVELFTEAHTDFGAGHENTIVVGATYNGTFPNTIGSPGPDFAISINDAFSTPTLWGASAFYGGNNRLPYSDMQNPDQALVTPLPAALPLFISGLIILGFIGGRRKITRL